MLMLTDGNFMWTNIVVGHLWEIQIVLLAIFTVALLVKKSWKKFPIFSAYSFFCFVQGAVLYGVLNTQWSSYVSPRQWVRGYWIAEVVGIILGFGVIYEIFYKLLNSYSALRTLAS